MVDKEISINLYENGDWLDHKLPRETMKQVIHDAIKQMSDESLRWLLNGLTLRQLDELAGGVRVEKLERERSPSHPPESQNELSVFGDL